MCTYVCPLIRFSPHPSYTFRIISEVVVNFPNNLDEVTLTAEPESVRLKNYVEEDNSEFLLCRTAKMFFWAKISPNPATLAYLVEYFSPMQ